MSNVGILLPFFGTLLGALIPISLGFIYYRFQKRHDRLEQIYFEKRETYRRVLSSLYIYVSNRLIEKTDTVSREEVQSVVGELMLLKLIAPKVVAEYADKVFDFAGVSPNEAGDYEDKEHAPIGNLAELMRIDLAKGR